ncbi:MAG TPA: hypothetical protein VHM91_15500, partial [Verrucomicrobiales bacterium]|nr:hypothetical protein [Verrucomicrobiales bacterium]
MKTRLFPLLPAFVILTCGAFLLRYQRREISVLESSARRNAASPLLLQPGASLSTSPAKGDQPQAGSLSGEARVTAFIENLREQLHPFVEKADRESLQQLIASKADRASLLLGLKPAETEALHNFLKHRPGNSLTQATREWIVQNRGDEAAGKFDAAEAASRTASVEHDAQDAIFRLSRIVDLTPEQKDRLYASFVRKASSTAPPGPVPSELSFSFSIQDTPSIENPAALARSLLTPEQLSLL